MALSDWTPSSASKSSVTQANDIPAPRPDSAVNAPPPDQHRRVIDFVKESPAARYSFDSRLNRDAEHAELCRIDARGNKSCIKLSMHSKALFKSMQGLGFYCALPAEPHRTDMQCDAMPKLS